MNPPPVSRYGQRESDVAGAVRRADRAAAGFRGSGVVELIDVVERGQVIERGEEGSDALVPPPAAVQPIDSRGEAPRPRPSDRTSSPADTKSSMAVTESNPKTAAKSEASGRRPSSAPKPARARQDRGCGEAAGGRREGRAGGEGRDQDRGGHDAHPPRSARRPRRRRRRIPRTRSPGPSGCRSARSRIPTPPSAWPLRSAIRTSRSRSPIRRWAPGRRRRQRRRAPRPSSPAASPGDLYDVYVSGMSAVEADQASFREGTRRRSVAAASVVVRPSLAAARRRDALQDLAVDGLKVQVRRAGSGAVAAAPRRRHRRPRASAGETLHRVRVGGFPTRRPPAPPPRSWRRRGYKPYIARGDE